MLLQWCNSSSLFRLHRKMWRAKGKRLRAKVKTFSLKPLALSLVHLPSAGSSDTRKAKMSSSPSEVLVYHYIFGVKRATEKIVTAARAAGPVPTGHRR